MEKETKEQSNGVPENFDAQTRPKSPRDLKDRHVRIIIKCPESDSPLRGRDRFTQTVPSPNFKPLAVWRRTIHLSVNADKEYAPNCRNIAISRIDRRPGA